MTEKRFENRLNKDIKKFHALNPVWDNKLETAWNVFEMIDLLNKYNKEYLDCHNDVLRLEKENEKLKQQNKMLRTNVGKLTDDVKYLRNLPSTHQKENKQLKKENLAIKKTLHTIINQIDVDKINNNKVVYSARILFKEKEFQFIYDIYKKSLEEL